jgi:hypothetical protein
MSNFLKGMGSVFNLFPETDYMAMVPDEGEMLQRARADVARSMKSAYLRTKLDYGIDDSSLKTLQRTNKAKIQKA